MPCQLCEQRGLYCGIEEKVLGPKSQSKRAQLLHRQQGQDVLSLDRPVPIPAEDSFTELECLYIQEFLRRNCFQNQLLLGQHLIHRSHQERYFLTKRIASLILESSSKPVRYATLAWAAFQLDKTRPSIKLQYLGQCYEYMRQAISNAAFVEVVFGSYFLMRLAVPMKSPSEVIFDHAIGLSLALRSLQEFPSSLSLYEWLWLEQKCLSTLNHLRYCILRRHSSPSPESAFTPQIQRKVAWICSLYSDLLVPINVFMQISERPQIYLKRLRLHQGCFSFFLSPFANQSPFCQWRRRRHNRLHIEAQYFSSFLT